MKHLTRVFFAVITLSVFSCATDTTNDLPAGFDSDNNQTELLISLEMSRTHLGNKAENGYPVYWSENDRIAVNGVSSRDAEIDINDRSRAIFSFDNLLSYPYAITYPYANGTTADLPIVAFPAEQNYVENSTESGILPMY